jgi:putative ABC transport system substrate-binding protein
MKVRRSILSHLISLGSKAQRMTPVRRIGWLRFETSGSGETHRADADLRDLGWIEGQNLIVDRRIANSETDLLLPLAEELVRLKVEMIVAEGWMATLAVENATSSIPIVFSRVRNPVRRKLVASLARPGANITGTSTFSPELDRKQLELLREVFPNAQRVGPLIVPEYEQMDRDHSLGMQAHLVEVAQEVGELESAIADVAQRGAQALYVPADPIFRRNIDLVLRAAQKHSLPVIVEGKGNVEHGGLMSYAPREAELDRQLAVFVDKILRGAKPADLPVQQPAKFELIINLKTAKMLGLTIPQSVLLRADEVIQ